MNKVIVMLIIGLFTISCNSKPDKNDKLFVEEALRSCESNAALPNMSEGQKKALKSYCSCSVDKLIGRFSYAEMMEMNNPSPELKDSITKLIIPCVKEYETNLRELKN